MVILKSPLEYLHPCLVWQCRHMAVRLGDAKQYGRLRARSNFRPTFWWCLAVVAGPANFQYSEPSAQYYTRLQKSSRTRLCCTFQCLSRRYSNPISQAAFLCMHPIWCIDEILNVILSYVDPPHTDRSSRAPIKPTGRNTFAVLARTCKTFSDPALDALWEFPKSILPLLQILPTFGKLEDGKYVSAPP